MNVLISVNRAFFEASKIMLRSLLKNNSWEKINIFMFHNELEELQIKELKDIADIYQGCLTAVRINDNDLEGVPTAALSKETYYRLFAPQILPKEIDRVLYLDVDILVVGDLKELYQTDFGGSYFAAAEDTSMGVEKFKRLLNIPKQYTYINAGVLLMNLKELRENMNIKKALDFARKYPRKVPNCDQDVINGLYYSKIKVVDNKFNYEARFHSIEDLLTYPLQYVRFLFHNDIKIIHYMGKYKPWKEGFNGKFCRVYYDAARGTDLSNYSRCNMKFHLYNVLTYLLQTGYF